MHKIYHHDLEDSDRLSKMLEEYLGLFMVMAEEDPGYRNQQMLQDAGLAPVGNQPTYG